MRNYKISTIASQTAREYEVELADGEVQEYSVNVIAEYLYSNVDYDGKRFVIMYSIVDHKSDASATTKEKEFPWVRQQQFFSQTISTGRM